MWSRFCIWANNFEGLFSLPKEVLVINNWWRLDQSLSTSGVGAVSVGVIVIGGVIAGGQGVPIPAAE